MTTLALVVLAFAGTYAVTDNMESNLLEGCTKAHPCYEITEGGNERPFAVQDNRKIYIGGTK